MLVAWRGSNTTTPWPRYIWLNGKYHDDTVSWPTSSQFGVTSGRGMSNTHPRPAAKSSQVACAIDIALSLSSVAMYHLEERRKYAEPSPASGCRPTCCLID